MHVGCDADSFEAVCSGVVGVPVDEVYFSGPSALVVWCTEDTRSSGSSLDYSSSFLAQRSMLSRIHRIRQRLDLQKYVSLL